MPDKIKTPASGSDQSQDKWIKLFICLILCLGIEFSAAWFTQQSVSTWYPTIAKPVWTPPNIAFPIVWTILYTLMALSLWIISIEPTPNKNGAYAAFSIQLALNFCWSWLFFYLQNPFLAMIDIALLIAAITATIAYFWRISVLAGLLLFPYIIWVAFAATLNLYILFLN